MTTEEILKGLEWKDATETSSSIGILNEVYKGHELLLIKNSKTGPKRATIMIKKGDQVTNVIIGKEPTTLVRANIINLEHLVGFPLMYNDKQNQLYLGRPSEGWQAVADITVVNYVATPVTLEELAGL
mgnify:CR=1 FL=1